MNNRSGTSATLSLMAPSDLQHASGLDPDYPVGVHVLNPHDGQRSLHLRPPLLDGAVGRAENVLLDRVEPLFGVVQEIGVFFGDCSVQNLLEERPEIGLLLGREGSAAAGAIIGGRGLHGHGDGGDLGHDIGEVGGNKANDREAANVSPPSAHCSRRVLSMALVSV